MAQTRHTCPAAQPLHAPETWQRRKTDLLIHTKSFCDLSRNLCLKFFRGSFDMLVTCRTEHALRGIEREGERNRPALYLSIAMRSMYVPWPSPPSCNQPQSFSDSQQYYFGCSSFTLLVDPKRIGSTCTSPSIPSKRWTSVAPTCGPALSP